jgi:cell division protein FtsB
MKARLEKIKQENRNYKEEIEKLQTPEEIEKMARKMGFIKKNEISFEIDKISKEDKSKIKKGKNF